MEELLVSMQVLKIWYREEQTLPKLKTVINTPKLFKFFSLPIVVNDTVVVDDYNLLVPLINSPIIHLYNDLDHLLLENNVHDPLLVNAIFFYQRLFHDVLFNIEDLGKVSYSYWANKFFIDQVLKDFWANNTCSLVFNCIEGVHYFLVRPFFTCKKLNCLRVVQKLFEIAKCHVADDN